MSTSAPQDLSALLCEVCVLVFSVTDRRSFHRTAQLRLLLRETQPQTPIILVGNKSDLVRTREVTSQGEMNLCFLTRPCCNPPCRVLFPPGVGFTSSDCVDIFSSGKQTDKAEAVNTNDSVTITINTVRHSVSYQDSQPLNTSCLKYFLSFYTFGSRN